MGKLFAKHFKVGEQQEALAKGPLAVAVGTPNRIGKLADLGALRLDRLKYLLVDVHLDAKQRCRPGASKGLGCVLVWESVCPQRS